MANDFRIITNGWVSPLCLRVLDQTGHHDNPPDAGLASELLLFASLAAILSLFLLALFLFFLLLLLAASGTFSLDAERTWRGHCRCLGRADCLDNIGGWRPVGGWY